MRVVAADVVVKLLPEPLDDVRKRRVRREEVEDDAATERGERAEVRFDFWMMKLSSIR